MKAKAKSTKSSSPSKVTSTTFGHWLRAIPQSSEPRVTLQPPIKLSKTQWTMLAVDATRQGITLDELLQNSIDTFVGMVQEDLGKAA
jgi:hypothetical protein